MIHIPAEILFWAGVWICLSCALLVLLAVVLSHSPQDDDDQDEMDYIRHRL